MFWARSGAKRRMPPSCATVRPARVMPLAARARKSTVWPPPRAADRDRDVLRAQRRGGGVPVAEDAEPPDEVAPPVASRRPVVRADREVDPAARLPQLLGDLHPRRPGADDQHGAVRQLPRVAVGAGVEAQQAGVVGDDGGDHRPLERAGRGHHVARVDDPVRGLDPEAGPAGLPAHVRYLDAAADRRPDLLRVGDEVVRDLLLGGEAIGVEARELEAGEPVVPGGPVGDQGIPALRAPALGDPLALEHEVRHAAAAQVLAHRQPGLARADDEDLDLLARHPASNSDCRVGPSVGARRADSK